MWVWGQEDPLRCENSMRETKLKTSCWLREEVRCLWRLELEVTCLAVEEGLV